MNSPTSSQDKQSMADMNINGEVRDQDTFVLGDDDEEEENEEESRGGAHNGAGPASISSPPPLYESIPWKDEESPLQEATALTSNSNSLAEEPKPVHDNTRPYKYYINRSDTLQGLSLRFGIDVSAVI